MTHVGKQAELLRCLRSQETNREVVRLAMLRTDLEQKDIHRGWGCDLTFPKTFPFSIKNYLHPLNGEDVARFTATTRYLLLNVKIVKGAEAKQEACRSE
ncbi:hypothetical protein CEXT_544051 [Caerostris extrusa]|uniref:Uncharacterized protein n=1 Tax=Caerostris extrusa TaxID=172846 RepID=A0AAV4SP99_CAEEX|nr:hypothetical protein CEXT_544051 [Caerostris extrusa]